MRIRKEEDMKLLASKIFLMGTFSLFVPSLAYGMSCYTKGTTSDNDGNREQAATGQVAREQTKLKVRTTSDGARYVDPHELLASDKIGGHLQKARAVKNRKSEERHQLPANSNQELSSDVTHYADGGEKSVLEYGARRNHENEVEKSPLVTDIALGKSKQSKEDTKGVSFISIDLETTGLEVDKDQITEIAAIRYVDGRPKSAFISLVKPSIRIDHRVEKLTGITNDMVQGEGVPTIDQLLEPLAEFLGEDVIVAHHAAFETIYLKINYERYGLSRPNGAIIDTKALVKRVFPKAKTNLWKLVERFKIEIQGSLHRAQADAYCCGEVLLGLLDKISQESQVSQAEALHILAHNPGFYLDTIFDRVKEEAVLNLRTNYPLPPSQFHLYGLPETELFADRDPWDIFPERYHQRD